ncbi:hypothetical protein O181_015754 [Austropuccinia psidii MF-1]|uniref:Major facilitator superfamily (MFS) profile domain-containing protein n=1 Tax=Austropuccinia psidii MF-1 TaxID=1389203 RepID=A0A9Q3C0G9_9BASI|nr:hypothetical protein [Austropuccinia psidii MF-1]
MNQVKEKFEKEVVPTSHDPIGLEGAEVQFNSDKLHEYQYSINEEGQTKTYVKGNLDEINLLKKLDWHMFPCVCFMYMLNRKQFSFSRNLYRDKEILTNLTWVMLLNLKKLLDLDRASIANAKIGGMEKDLELSSSDYSTAVLIFFVGYLSAEIPSNMILSRLRPSIFLSAITFLWGGVVALTSVVQSKEGLIVLRFFLGFVESGFFPGVLFFLASWYRKGELTKRIGILYCAGVISGAFGGLISGGVIDGLDEVRGIRGWRWLFIIEGVATLAVSVVVVFFLPDWPSNTRWLSAEEKALATLRLQVDKIERGVSVSEDTKLSSKEAFLAAVKDWRTYLFSFIYLMLLSAITISYFIPTITIVLGYTGQTAQFMTVPPYVVGCIVILVVSRSADYFDDRVFHIAVPITFAGLMYALCVPITSANARYVLVCLGFGAAYGALPPLLAWVPNEMAFPDEKRAVVQAFVNTIGNSASLYGSFLWPKEQEPEFHMGFSLTAAFCFTCGISCVIGKISLHFFGPSKAKITFPESKGDIKAM